MHPLLTKSSQKNKQTRKAIEIEIKDIRKIIMNIYAWEKSSRLATRIAMRSEKSKKFQS